MGLYLNPGTSGFEMMRNSEYVDKTGLASLVNASIGTNRMLACISRPRRFGKSYAAQMLCAYYDRSCDSHALFDDLAIAKDPSYEQHLNAYDVVCVDMAGAKPASDGYRDLVPFLTRSIGRELAGAYPEIVPGNDLASMLVDAVQRSGRKIVMVIDEWDAPLRETPELGQAYLEFLRSLFKNIQVTPKVFAAVYMTGILPIKKDGSQSAISDFHEYTMLEPGPFAPYVGFTEDEVHGLCDEHGTDFSEVKRWYDGYELQDVGSVYNPNSVMRAVTSGHLQSYWSQSSATDSLPGYLSLDFDGLGSAVVDLAAGLDVPVNTRGFSNDLRSFASRDDVLTLLIHLGYLTYDTSTGRARVPNEEIRIEFGDAIHRVRRDDTARRVAESVKLIDDTVAMDADAVARQIEKVHEEETAPLFYNSEQSLRSVVKLAYFAYRDEYAQMEELGAGAGFADIAYLPKLGSPYPALIVELKWDGSAREGIEQIRARRYPQGMAGLGRETLLVAIAYNKDAPAGQRRHHCIIERL